ncbi:hypothetical protein EXIGLDRAFT_837386 [Exidia glandulosa HHB12029]|uniref:Uncharacterized protein n=1 Tax=Exidia glandulosa HHB12029 TaxID=1314781 RepID=A0A165GW52_EXIGL|nr:hypothetical protein EXIGLDRAFT_837386 [Exidia glandulosa HHB12029]
MDVLSVVMISGNHRKILHSRHSLQSLAIADFRYVDKLIEHVQTDHARRCLCKDTQLENKLWISTSSTAVRSPVNFASLTPFPPNATTADVLRRSPLLLYVRLQESKKRQRSPQPEDTAPRKALRPPLVSKGKALSLVSKGDKLLQIVQTSASSPEPGWETRGNFRAALNTPNGVLIDNSAALGAVCNKALVDPKSRVCVLFASPSEFSAKRFSSTLAFAYDMSTPGLFSSISNKIDFLGQLASPTYAVLELDFDMALRGLGMGARYRDTTDSIQGWLEAFIAWRVELFVEKYSSLPSLRGFPRNSEIRQLIPTLLERLTKDRTSLLVCIHAFELTLERASLCSLWESRGIHATIRPVIKFVDDVLFAPLAASHKRKGIVFKIAITGTNPHVYLDWTKLADLPYQDVSLSLAALPLHGYTWEQCLTALRTFWQRLHTTGVAKDDLQTALNVPHDKLWRLRPEDARAVGSKTVPIDPATLIQMTNLLDNSRAARKVSTTRQPLTVGDFDTNVKLLKRYQACLPMLFPLVRDSPAFFRELVRDADAPLSYPLVKVPASAGWTWTYAQLGDADTPRCEAKSLQLALLVSLGLLKVQPLKDRDDAWKVCVAGPHAMQTLKTIIAEVDAYTRRELNPEAKISVNDFTLVWLRKVILEILNGKRMPAPKNEAEFQGIVLDLLRDFLQFNGQWRHQAQPEAWFRCGTKQKRWDGRGDIVMLLKIDNIWRVYIIELKYFLAGATAAATQAFLQEHNRALPDATPEYFKAALEIVKFPAGWVARLAKRALPGFDAKASVLTESDLRANYFDRKTKTWAIKTAMVMRQWAPQQVQTYVDGAVQGVGEELGEDVPGIADVRYTKYEEAAAGVVLTVFIPIALVLISNVLIYGAEGTKRNAHFRPAMAGVYHWTQDPTDGDIESVRKAKHTSRGE